MQLILSIWGASLSTILASVHLYGRYKSRTRLFTSYYFDSQTGGSDKIIIYNIGNVDIIVTDYKFFYSFNIYFGTKDYLNGFSDNELISINIKANDKYTLTFVEPYRINLKKRGKRNLYTELRVAGKNSKKVLKIC